MISNLLSLPRSLFLGCHPKSPPPPLLWGTLWGERCLTSQKRAFSSPEPLSLICNEPVASPSIQDHLTKTRRALGTWRDENVRSSEHAGACTMAANEGVIKAVVNFYQDDSECGVSWSFLRSTLCWSLAGKNVCAEESNTRLEKWRATWNAVNCKTDKNFKKYCYISFLIQRLIYIVCAILAKSRIKNKQTSVIVLTNN